MLWLVHFIFIFVNISMADHKIIFTEKLGWIEEEKCTNDTLSCAYDVTYIVCRSDPHSY